MKAKAATTVEKLLNIFKRLREQEGITIEEFADRADLHRTTIGLLERNERTPSVQVAFQMAEALDHRLSDLIAEAENTPGKTTSRKKIATLAAFDKRELKSSDLVNGKDLTALTGLTSAQLKTAIESCYDTLDTIDYQLVSKGILPIENLVELANLSSMVGNLLGSAIAEASNGIYKRNRPHAYPDLLPIKKPAVDLEIKVALETNKPKGHLPKAGRYITFRYALGQRDGSYERGKETRGNVVWLWEIRVGDLKIEDFAISNTEGDSGKTAVIKTEAFYAMKVVYFNADFCPHKLGKDGGYPGFTP